MQNISGLPQGSAVNNPNPAPGAYNFDPAYNDQVFNFDIYLKNSIFVVVLKNIYFLIIYLFLTELSWAKHGYKEQLEFGDIKL